MKNIRLNEQMVKQNFYLKHFPVIRIRYAIFIDVISILLILLFIYGATSKFIDYQKFNVELGKSPLLTNFSKPVAIGIPLLEIIISIMLAISKLRLLGLYAAFSLMVMFTTYIFVILNFSFYIPCSCGGVLQKLTWNQHLVFNIFFILLALTGIIIYPKKEVNSK